MSVEMLETVRVKAQNDAGYMVINKSDLSEVQELYNEEAVVEPVSVKLTKKEIAQQLKVAVVDEQTQASDLVPKAPWDK